MGNSYIDLIISKLREDKKIVRYLIISFVLLIFAWLAYSYFSKGTLEANVTGIDGNTRLIVSKISNGSEENKETIKVGRSAKFRLKPGNYKVAAEVEVGSRASAKVSSSFKEVSVRARANTSVEIKVEQAKVTLTHDLKDKPSFMSLTGEALYATTVYGVSNVYSLTSSDYSTIRKEPAYLRNVKGLCHFSNGTSVAVDHQGSVYRVLGSQASPIDLSSTYSEESPEHESSAVLQGTKNFVCTENSVRVLGSADVSSSLKVTATLSNPYDKLGYNYVKSQADESLWFFTAVNADSFDGEGSSISGVSKNLVRLSPDGTQKNITLDSYISGVSVYSESGFCFYYQKTIKCGDISTGKLRDPFKLPDNKLITNIEAIDGKRIAYSFGNSVWVLNVETGQSNQLYASDHDVVEGTMVIARDKGIISFGTQKVYGGQSSYKAPIVEYGGVGL